ncbi:MAG: hypothetical protein HQ575_06705, partial [Candidatus Omnitrophica bacterium]|nr:hypothetical protein [Candidatus Omnitrophota bacterium]
MRIRRKSRKLFYFSISLLFILLIKIGMLIPSEADGADSGGGTPPPRLDDAAIGQASVSNSFFDYVLDTPIVDSTWYKMGENVYKGPTEKLVIYNAQTGKFGHPDGPVIVDGTIYDEYGNIIEKIVPLYDSSGNPIGYEKWTYVYDGTTLVEYTRSVYNMAGTLNRSYRYFDLEYYTSGPNAGELKNFKTTTTDFYYRDGVVYLSVGNTYDSETGNRIGYSTVYFDAEGNEIRSYTYVYDSVTGRQMSRTDVWTDSYGNKWKRKYDTSPTKDGLNVPREDFRFVDGQWVPTYRETYNYDESIHRVTNRTYVHYHADGVTESQRTEYTYDPATGRKTSYTVSYKDADGIETRRDEYTYDPVRDIQTSRTNIWFDSYGNKWKRAYNTVPSVNGENIPRQDFILRDGQWVSTYKEAYTYNE